MEEVATGVEKASGRRLRREIGAIGLLFTSLGTIIGSGWLFASLYAANEAGPASLISWAIGGAALILLALIHAELGSMFPLAGGSGRFPHFSYGSLVGFAVSWTTWIGFVATPAIEVEAALQYATNYIGWLTYT
ncbi:MAG: amino acid permease, partial [Candidatus Dormibacteraceae bacterium]